MRYKIVSIGKDRKKVFEPIVADYLDRLSHYVKVEAIVAGEAQGEDAAARRAEAELLRKRIGNRFVALDERGSLFTSAELAQALAKEARRGDSELCFVLGGPSGFDRDFLGGAAWSLALSKLTLPHQMARAVLAEQLYRAHTILRGEPYSK